MRIINKPVSSVMNRSLLIDFKSLEKNFFSQFDVSFQLVTTHIFRNHQDLKMIFENSLILTLFVAYCESYNNVYQQASTGTGIKSYGGYFPDASGQNKAASQFVSSQNYQQPSLTSYQPYGWNFNQPSKTYGNLNINLMIYFCKSII